MMSGSTTAMDASSEQEIDEFDSGFVEVDPSGRYGRKPVQEVIIKCVPCQTNKVRSLCQKLRMYFCGYNLQLVMKHSFQKITMHQRNSYQLIRMNSYTNCLSIMSSNCQLEQLPNSWKSQVMFITFTFLFDIEADTAISVASEMVTELDLTDEDVTTIAEMIDQEIQARVPGWLPGKSCEDTPAGDQETIPQNFEADTVGEPGEVVLDHLPLGRQYWSDSPKGFNGGSPPKSTHSDVSSHMGLHAKVAIMNSTILSPIDEDFDTSNSRSKDTKDVAPPSQNEAEQATYGELKVDIEQERQLKSSKDLLVGNDVDTNTRENDDISVDVISVGGSLKKPILFPKECKPEDLNLAIQKLVNLFSKQQHEIEMLQRKHDLAIRELLNEVPFELHSRILNMCPLKVQSCRGKTEMPFSASSCLPESIIRHARNQLVQEIVTM